ncbi:MAG TPA: S41 family peptidase [Erysipelothrix sp.]|nr:S41 family peptidase [Erysipelothrix sp.]
MEDNKVNVKLEKHLWPDEIKSRQRKRSIILVVIVGLLFSFAFGWATGRVNSRSNNNQPIVNPENPNTTTPVLTPEQQFSKFQYIYEVLSNNWYFSNEMEDAGNQIMDNAINGMLELNGDPHTSYMSQEELKDFEEGINQNFVGIGVQYYQVDGYSIVLKVFNNSPAENAGVLPGDIFIEVDGVNVVDLDTDTISEMVKGEENTIVNIVFQRNEELVETNISRAPITSTTYAEILEPGIGYLELNSFGLSTPNEVERELQMMKDNGVTKIVIDVRDNSGGYLQALNEIASFFLEPNSVIIQQEDVDGHIVKTFSTNNQFENFEDIVILINQNSASAAEVLALALRDNLGVELVGTKTFGKGTVQTTLPLADGSSLKYTIAQWISPNGEKIHHSGIEPTIEVKSHEVFYANTPSLKEDEIIHVDEVSESLIFAQQALDFLGFNPGRFDGYFSQETLEAYHQYQEANELETSDQITRQDISQFSSKVYQKYNSQMRELDIQLEAAIELVR